MDVASTIAAVVFWSAAGVLFYAILVYPALAGLLGGRRSSTAPRRRAASSALPSVTLIIPAHNEEAVLARKIENSLQLEYPHERLSILVASDGSTDATVEIATTFSNRDRRVDVFAGSPNRGKAAILNHAVARARTELVCLCDANVFFRHDALRLLAGTFADERIGAVSGNVQLSSDESDFGEGESFYYRIERAVHSGESRIGSMMGVDGGMYMMRRSLFRPLPEDTILDDFVISMQVIQQGYRIVYNGAAIAAENGTPSSKDEFRRRVRVSAGAAQVLKRRQWPPLSRPVELWQFVSHKLLRWLTPLWLALLFVSSAALWNEGTLYRVILLAQLAFYCLAAAAAVSVPFRKTKIGGIAFYFTMSQIAMAVGIIKGLFWKQTGRWQRTARTPLPETPT